MRDLLLLLLDYYIEFYFSYLIQQKPAKSVIIKQQTNNRNWNSDFNSSPSLLLTNKVSNIIWSK